ncbi:MAG: DUF3352 domain-containing protein [Actinomycetes bacterium]
MSSDHPGPPAPPPSGGGAPPPGSEPGPEPGPPSGSEPGAELLDGGASGGRPLAAWVVPTVVAVVLVALVGGAFAVGSALRSGGSQPENVLPGDAVAFAKLDLDPSAGQKLAALRFMRQFPTLEDQVKGDDLRRSLYEALSEGEGDLEGVDYETDVEPWLGQRVGIAALPPAKGGGDEPVGVVALQVTDEDAAREGIRTIAEASGESPPGVATLDGYALVAENQKTADDAASQAEGSSLAESGQFTDDMEAIGEPGVSTGWFDLDGLARLAGGSGEQSASAMLGGAAPVSGRLAYAVRFDGDDLEAVAKARGVKGVKDVGGDGDTGLARLPESTVAAMGVANGGELVRQGWDQAYADAQGTPAGQQLQLLIAQAESFGFALPDDLATLFGSSFTLALDEGGLNGAVPRVGARVTTDTTEALALLDKLEQLAGPMLGQVLVRRPTEDGIVVTSDPSYAAQLGSDGALGQTDGFQAALPEVDGADFAVWVDLDRLASALGSEAGDAETRESMEAVDGIGATGAIEDTGDVTYRLRVVTR